MLVTRQTKIPFSWVIMAMVPWAFFYFMITVNGVNFFILNRLIDNPAVLTFSVTLPGLFFAFVPLGSYINFMSDRIWTRWGRRKVFLVFGFSGIATMMFFYPLAGSIWVFLGLMFGASFFAQFNGTFEALKLEIIPPDLRGRSVAIGQWIGTSMNIVFWMAVIGRMDEVIPFFTGHLNGLTILYWGASASLLIMVYIYFFGIHEVNPNSTIVGEKFSLKAVWKALSMPQLRYLYILGIASSLLGTGLGSVGSLLYINQWGYSFQEMGVNIAVGGIINLCLIPIIGILADKGQNRMRIWLTCAMVIMLLNITYFSYVTWYLPDQRPSLVEMIFFGETTCIVGIISGMVYFPLIYDYIPRNLMGTYSAGFGILSTIVAFLMGNGLGLFLLCWARLFQPPAGEMVQVCFANEMSKPQVAQVLNHEPLFAPSGDQAAASDIIARPWYANGMVKDSGFCYEIRLRDADSEAKLKRKEDLVKEGDTLEAKIKEDRKSGAAAEAIAKEEKELAPMRAEREALGVELGKRASTWRAEVLRGLGGVLMKDGQEILGKATAKAVVSSVSTSRKAKEKELAKLDASLRAEDPSAIGLTLVGLDKGFALSISAIQSEGKDPNEVIRHLCQRLCILADKVAPGLITNKGISTAVRVQPATILDLALVENPVRTFVSPISKVMNAVLSQFTELPPPDQKLISLARNLCKGGEISHARVEALQGRNGVRMTAVAAKESPGEPEAWTAKLLEKARTECASLKLTVPRPVVDQGVVPIKYNYLAGYLYVFTLVSIGFGLVRYFISKEKAGVVRKLGREEALSDKEKAAATAAANANSPQMEAVSGEIYTPGYLIPKVLFALLGIGLIAVAGKQAWPDVRLLLMGARTEAIAVSAIATKPGQGDVLMKNQAELGAKIKQVGDSKDYNWTFYNVFAFEAKTGQQVTFRREVGCKLKPSMPLIDDSGLSTTALLFYDPQNLSRAVLPLEYSTWFLPVLLGIFGLGIFGVGLTLAFHARKPIQLSANAAVIEVPGRGEEAEQLAAMSLEPEQ